MGLCYGLHNMHRKPNITENHRLHDLYYNRNPRVNIKQLYENFEEFNFNDTDDIDVLKITLYYFANKVLNGRKDERTSIIAT